MVTGMGRFGTTGKTMMRTDSRMKIMQAKSRKD